MKAYWVANYTEIKDNERLKKYVRMRKVRTQRSLKKIINKLFSNKFDT